MPTGNTLETRQPAVLTRDENDTIAVLVDDAKALVTRLREIERFLDECDEQTADALDDYFGFSPVAESFSADLSLHADMLDALLLVALTTPMPLRAEAA
jgi:hypothetical protein